MKAMVQRDRIEVTVPLKAEACLLAGTALIGIGLLILVANQA